VLTAKDFVEAWALAERNPAPELCIVDLQMPGADAKAGLSGPAIARRKPEWWW